MSGGGVWLSKAIRSQKGNPEKDLGMFVRKNTLKASTYEILTRASM